MKKNNYFIIIVTFIIFNTSSLYFANAASFLKKNTLSIKENAKFGINKEVFDRMKNYLEGKINSKNLSKKASNISGVYFSISNDGQFSSSSFCDAYDFNDCAEQHLGFQTLKSCERISKQKCFLIFRGREFLPTRSKQFELEKYFKMSTSDVLAKHYDIQGFTIEEINDPEN